jgi:hypothetical protein
MQTYFLLLVSNLLSFEETSQIFLINVIKRPTVKTGAGRLIE